MEKVVKGYSAKRGKCSSCENCYTCQQGVSSTVNVNTIKEERASKCKNCYTCQQGVSSDITVDSMGEQGTKAVVVSKDERREKCRKCYTCQQGVSPEITADDMKGKKAEIMMPFTWYIFPTNGCNLSCTYCYASNKPGNMEKDTKSNVLRWLFDKQPHKKITCHFFGGEPTVMWDMMVDIIQIGSQMAKLNGYEVTWSMTSNGTLLYPERLDFIEANFRKRNPFLLSIDGRPETHDKYRVFKGGKPSHHLIPVDAIVNRFPTIECRPTIMPDTAKDWFEDFKWLRNKGFKSIAIEPDYETYWTSREIEDYRNLLRQLGDYYKYAYKVDKPIYMKFIDGVKGQLNNGEPPGGRMCGVAYNCGAIDHRGYLYACQRYASYNSPTEYSIGNVVDGWDEFKLFETQALFRENVCGDVTKGFNCRTCDIRLFCHKGCNAANRKLSGHREKSFPMYCVLSKVEASVALEVLGSLGLLAAKPDPKQGCQSCKV